MATTNRGIPVGEVIPLSLPRRVMARGMKASVETIALGQLSREIDVTALVRLGRERLAEAVPRISLNTLIMATVARTLPRHPLLNAELQGEQILAYATVNLGMAVAVPEGLVVVVIRDAQRLALSELAVAIDERARRARQGKLQMSDIEGGTFTVSNLGMYGIDAGVPIPRPPESAILLLGAARPRPAVVDGQLNASN